MSSGEDQKKTKTKRNSSLLPPQTGKTEEKCHAYYLLLLTDLGRWEVAFLHIAVGMWSGTENEH